MKKKLKFKKLLHEYRSLQYELEYVQEVLVIANQEFEEYYRSFCSARNINISDLENNNKQSIQSAFQKPAISTQKIETQQRAQEYDHKLIFREIAKKLHPDTLAIDDPRLQEYEESFKKANSALRNGEWGSLFDIADKYDVDIKDYDTVNKSIKDDILRIQSHIKKEKTTYGWKLFNCEEDVRCKNNVIKNFLKHLFNYTVKGISI